MIKDVIIKVFPQGKRGRVVRKPLRTIYVVVKEVLELQPHNIDTITIVEEVFDTKGKAQDYIDSMADEEAYYIVPRKLK